MKFEQIKRRANVAEEKYLVGMETCVKEFYQQCLDAIDGVPDDMVEEFIDKIAKAGFELKEIVINSREDHAEVSFYSTVGEDPSYANYIYQKYTLEDVEVAVSINSGMIMEIAMDSENVDIYFEDMLSKKHAEKIFGKYLMGYEYEDKVYGYTKCTICKGFF